MSVPKSKRKESQFEVFHHWTEARKKITDLLLMDFGYSFEKFYKKLERRYGGKSFEELDETQKADYTRKKKRAESFDEWYISQERVVIIECLHSLNEHIYTANSIYPTCQEELTERRIHQDIAIGQCYRPGSAGVNERYWKEITKEQAEELISGTINVDDILKV